MSFAVVVAGNLPISDYKVINEGQIVFDLKDLPIDSKHVTIFMTGAEPFPEGFGGTVYIGYPTGNTSALTWSYLGFICNRKPSAVFKISNLPEKKTCTDNVFHSMINIPKNHAIGLHVVNQSTIMQLDATSSNCNRSTEMIIKNIITNFENYAGSFTEFIDNRGYFISVGVLTRWYERIQRLLKEKPTYFLTSN
ncbi:hypothetical protein SNEBB_005338 [Seison nebaliae]|nr:hypothetical protein SNEBB_005338 [Seison nebaliae]